MTGDYGRTPWWEFDPNERPVPLDPTDRWHAPDDAELIAHAELVAIARQDTEPTGLMIATSIKRRPSVSRIPVRGRAAVAACILVLACGAMFSMGWSHGSRVAASSGPGADEVRQSTDAVTPTTDKEAPPSRLKGRSGDRSRDMEETER